MKYLDNKQNVGIVEENNEGDGYGMNLKEYLDEIEGLINTNKKTQAKLLAFNGTDVTEKVRSTNNSSPDFIANIVKNVLSHIYTEMGCPEALKGVFNSYE